MNDPTNEPTATAAADARLPQDHPFVTHLSRVAEDEAGRAHRAWEPGDAPLPSLYVSHGAPPLFEDLAWMAELRNWARAMAKPRGIVIVSAHWESAPAAMTSTVAGTPLVYDFWGFAPLYYEMQYSTPDASELGRRLVGALSRAERPHEHQRGLDHGAWVPLKVMYPEADIPVVQVSLPSQQPDRLLELGRRLAELRSEGILVIGSGFMTHSLRYVRPDHAEQPPSWSVEFDAWAAHALATGDLDELVDFAKRAPGLPYAHPTVEHFTPLFVTMGAATDPSAPVTTVIEGYMIGLSRRSFQAA